MAPGRDVGMLFQNPLHQLFCDTVGEEVSFGPRNFGCLDAGGSARAPGRHRPAVAAVSPGSRPFQRPAAAHGAGCRPGGGAPAGHPGRADPGPGLAAPVRLHGLPGGAEPRRVHHSAGHPRLQTGAPLCPADRAAARWSHRRRRRAGWPARPSSGHWQIVEEECHALPACAIWSTLVSLAPCGGPWRPPGFGRPHAQRALLRRSAYRHRHHHRPHRPAFRAADAVRCCSLAWSPPASRCSAWVASSSAPCSAF